VVDHAGTGLVERDGFARLHRQRELRGILAMPALVVGFM